MNANDNKLTPEQALDLLRQVTELDALKLSLREHSALQQALAVLRPLVAPKELTTVPETNTVN